MHCSNCGQELEPGTATCTRCGANVTPQARRHRLVVTLLFACIAIAVVAVVIGLVLAWHSQQLMSM